MAVKTEPTYAGRRFTGLARHAATVPMEELAAASDQPTSEETSGQVVDDPSAIPAPRPAVPAAKKVRESDKSKTVSDPAAPAEPREKEPKPTTSVIAAVDPDKEPVVVVDNLHVKYKVFSSGKAAGGAGAKGLFTRASKGLEEVHALKGISFTAYKNESIGVLGSNGSGKSTLLRAITGLTPAAEGAVWASSRPNLLGVGAALIPALSGNDNITLGCLALGFSRSEIEELRPQIIEFAELEKFIDFPMKTYSSGMAARLKFAIAASKQHDILIVDEALAVGDARFRKRSEAKIREIRENAGTIFLVSHSMKSIRDTCNRAIWIEKGVQKLDGDPAEVIKAYEASRSAGAPTAAQKAAAAKKRKAAAAKKKAAAAKRKAAAVKSASAEKK